MPLRRNRIPVRVSENVLLGATLHHTGEYNVRVMHDPKTNTSILIDKEGRRIPFSARALNRTPDSITRLRKRTVPIVRALAQQRALQSQLPDIENVIKTLTRVQNAYFEFAKATSLRKLSETNFYKKYNISFNEIKTLQKKFPQLQSVVRLLNQEIDTLHDITTQLRHFKNARTSPAAVSKRKDRIVYRGMDGKLKIAYPDLDKIKTEAERRHSIVTKTLKTFQVRQKEIQRVLRKNQVSERAKNEALLFNKIARKTTGQELLPVDATRDIYEHNLDRVHELETSEKKRKQAVFESKLRLKVGKYIDTIPTLDILQGYYTMLVEAKSFEEATQRVNQMKQVLKQLQNVYGRDLRSIPELSALFDLEKFQLTIPENDSEARTLAKKANAPKDKRTNSALLIRHENGMELLPTSIKVLNEAARQRLELITIALKEFRERVNTERKNLEKLS